MTFTGVSEAPELTLSLLQTLISRCTQVNYFMSYISSIKNPITFNAKGFISIETKRVNNQHGKCVGSFRIEHLWGLVYSVYSSSIGHRLAADLIIFKLDEG